MSPPLDATPAGRVAIVTGASRGVGRATIDRLAARGYAVVANYLHDQTAAESAVESILAEHGAAVTVRADVTDDVDVHRLFAETIEAFGRVDALVHTVEARSAPTSVADTDLDEFDALWRMNTRATLIVNREAARSLCNGGAIVNLSASANGFASPNRGAFAISKAAADVLTRVLAMELRHRDITVNAVSPEAGTCTPHAIAGIVAHLLSAAGHNLTGQILRVDENFPRGT